MKINLSSILITSFVMALTSCGSKKQDHGAEPPKVVASNDSKNVEPAAAQQAVPKFLIARVSNSEIHSKQAKVDFVAVSSSSSIQNGEEAAKAFAAGEPILTSESSKTNLANSAIRYNLGLSVQEPYPGNGYPSNNPCGTPDPCRQPPDPCSCEYSGGGILSFFGDVIHGIFGGIGTILPNIYPQAWVGNTGVGYGYQNQYPYGPNQYTVYQPVPGQVYNNPNQPNQPVPSQPRAPSGQEPMPSRLTSK